MTHQGGVEAGGLAGGDVLLVVVQEQLMTEKRKDLPVNYAGGDSDEGSGDGRSSPSAEGGRPRCRARPRRPPWMA